MYHPTTRVLTVLELLQAHRTISGRELAERLEVDRRTVRHYIALLQDMGIPVEATHGRHGGYTLRPGFRLPPLMLSEDEALALTLGLMAARKLGLAVGAPAAEGALAKLERVLPAAVRERVQAVQETLVVDVASPYDAPAGGVLATLAAAAQAGQRVRLRYRSWQGETSERPFDPYGVVFHGGRWFAAGHCHARGDMRVFRLDRVLGAEPDGDTFARPPGFDILAFVLRSLATTPGRWRVEVLLRAPPERLRRRVPPAMATLEEAEGGAVLRCAVQDLAWLAHFLAGLRVPLVVREPPELREALRDLAAEAAALAEMEEP